MSVARSCKGSGSTSHEKARSLARHRQRRFGAVYRTGASLGSNPDILILDKLNPSQEVHQILKSGEPIGTLSVEDGSATLKCPGGARGKLIKTRTALVPILEPDERTRILKWAVASALDWFHSTQVKLKPIPVNTAPQPGGDLSCKQLDQRIRMLREVIIQNSKDGERGRNRRRRLRQHIEERSSKFGNPTLTRSDLDLQTDVTVVEDLRLGSEQHCIVLGDKLIGTVTVRGRELDLRYPDWSGYRFPTRTIEGENFFTDNERNYWLRKCTLDVLKQHSTTKNLG